MATEAAHGEATTNGTTNGGGRVSFSELVRAHHEFDAAVDAAAAEAVERRFRSLLEAFEASSRRDRRCLLVPRGALGSRAHPPRAGPARPAARTPEARVPAPPRLRLGHRRHARDRGSPPRLRHPRDQGGERARGSAARGRDAVAPARRVAPARVHRTAPARSARSEGRDAVRSERASRAATDRGVHVPIRREARPDALRRGNARSRSRRPRRALRRDRRRPRPVRAAQPRVAQHPRVLRVGGGGRNRRGDQRADANERSRQLRDRPRALSLGGDAGRRLPAVDRLGLGDRRLLPLPDAARPDRAGRADAPVLRRRRVPRRLQRALDEAGALGRDAHGCRPRGGAGPGARARGAGPGRTSERRSGRRARRPSGGRSLR